MEDVCGEGDERREGGVGVWEGDLEAEDGGGVGAFFCIALVGLVWSGLVWFVLVWYHFGIASLSALPGER